MGVTVVPELALYLSESIVESFPFGTLITDSVGIDRTSDVVPRFRLESTIHTGLALAEKIFEKELEFIHRWKSPYRCDFE